MWLRHSGWMIALLLLVQPDFARAQQRIVVEVETNAPDALLYADDQFLGLAAHGPFVISAAAGSLSLLPDESDGWSIAPVVVSLQALPGDTVSVSMQLPYYYRIESMPFGADVFLETETGLTFIGRTPLVYENQEPLEDRLVLERAGFVTQRIRPGGAAYNVHAVMLDSSERLDAGGMEVAWQPPPVRRVWIDAAAAALAVTAGVLAIHYKFEADRLYEDYRTTGDPAGRTRIREADVMAGVALGAMQVGVGVFAIRLIFR
jgi:hypothetical protein